MWHNIMNSNPSIDPKKFSANMRDILNKFLHKNPQERLGCSPHSSAKVIMEHPWFSNIDFDSLMSSNPPTPPFKPDVEKETDTTYVSSEILKQTAKDSMVKVRNKKAAETDFGDFEFSEEDILKN